MIYRVSPHVLADVRSCAMRGWTRHVMGYTSVGDSIKAAAGSAYHAGMAVFLDPKVAEEGVAKRERALAALHATYDGVWDACPADKLDEAYTPANLHKLFDRWMETHPRESVPWREVVEVETAFVSRRWVVASTGPSSYDIELSELPLTAERSSLGDYVELIVRPDAVVIDSTGMLRYVDTKTTGWSVTDANWLRALRLSMQTQLYADAVMQRFAGGPIAPLLGGWINACEIKKLPGSSAAPPKLKKDGTPYAASKCPLHGLPYAQCGLEHMKTVIQECTTDPESVAYAVELARKAATTFVLLHRQHQEHAPRAGADDAIVMDLTHEAWRQYPLRNIPVDGIANEKCRFCPAAEWCDAGRVIGAIPSTMQYNPWPVETGQREHAA